jgi:beta-lactamase regulating signal transducer with metallopeptidase domain
MASFTWMVNWAGDGLALLAESSVRAAVLLGAAGAVCFVLRRRSAAVRHLIWALSLAALVATPVSLELGLKLRVPAWWRPAAVSAVMRQDDARVDSDAADRRAVAVRGGAVHGAPAGLLPGSVRVLPPAALSLRTPVDAANGAEAATRADYAPVAGVEQAAEGTLTGAVAGRAAVSPTTLSVRGALPALLVGAWAVGFLVLLARFGIGHWRVRKMARGATVIDVDADVAGCFPAGRAVRFLQSAGETMPMTWGWRKPVVLLPASFGKWDGERRAMTIGHELAHIRRADWLTQTLAQLARAAYWFHPLVWLGLRRMRIEADRACDDMVLRSGVRASGYAGHLVQAAREFRTAGLRPWVAIAMAHPSSLNHRVRYVLDEKVERAGLGRRGGLALGLTVALIVLAVPSIEAVGQTASPALEQRVELERAVPQDVAADVLVSTPVEQEVEVARDLTLLAQGQSTRRAPNSGAVERQLGDELAMRAAQAMAQARMAQAEMAQAGSRAEQAKMQRAMMQAQLEMQALQGGIEHRKQPRLSSQALQAAAAALRKALGSSNSDVRAEAAEALGLLGSTEGANLEALGKALADSEPSVQKNAVESLGQLLCLNPEMPADEAVRWLGPAVSSSDPDLRREAAAALGRLRGAAAINAATQLAGDADAEVQREAIESLGHLLSSGDAEAARAALPVLKNALQHNDPSVRRQLVETLGSLHSIAEDVVPLLVGAAEDPDPSVQREAVEALGRISSDEAGMEHWFDDLVENQIEAQEALAQIEMEHGFGEARETIAGTEP